MPAWRSAASTARWAPTLHDGASPWFVTEADESDGSFALLEPAMAIVTNIENDHLTSDDELPGMVRAFGEFLAEAARATVWRSSEPTMRWLHRCAITSCARRW